MFRGRLSAPIVRLAAAAPCRDTCSEHPLLSSSAPLLCTRRHKASSVKIANRRKVEMFVGKRFHLPTRLRTAAPDVAREWNYERNPMHLYPEIIGIGHASPVWWRCEECDHEYEMSVEKRVVRGGGCPVCLERASLSVAQSRNATKDTEGVPRLREDDLLEGEANAALRPKRPTMLNLRTKY